MILGEGIHLTVEPSAKQPSVFEFTLTSNLTQPLYFTQSAPNAVTIDWGDGSAKETSANTSASVSHTYASAGDYTVTFDCADGETWIPGGTFNSKTYSFLGEASGKSVAYPTLISAAFGNGSSLDVSQCMGYCTGLTFVKIPKSIITVASNAFISCSNIASIVLGTGIKVTSVFGASKTHITSVTVLDSVISFPSGAFDGCNGITSVHITDIVKWCNIVFGSSTSNPLFYGHNLYLNDELITSLVIPQTVTSIGDFAFIGCTGFTSITIGKAVTSIGTHAFSGCTGLTSITIGKTVTSIGNAAFYGCTLLIELTCYAVNPPTMGPQTFYGVPETCAFYVLSSSVDSYKNAQYWSDRAAYIQAIPTT